MLRVGQRLGKYKLQAKISQGSFATVFRAVDTLEGVNVALKIPHSHLITKEVIEDFSREVRLAARLDHPNILSLKTADHIDGHFVIAFPLGEESLEDRLQRRMSVKTALDLGEQLLRAVAFAHHSRIIHCDIKPDNVLLFANGAVRLCDFGISKVAHRTISAGGEGTLGYMAPEQAMGRPSARSDVFAIGLVLWRMFSGKLPEWPYAWPPPGHDKIKRLYHPDMLALLKRALELKPGRRFDDADQMLAAYLRVKKRVLRRAAARKSPTGKRPTTRDWKQIRHQQFQRQFAKLLATKFQCTKCGGPVSEAMRACPWCGVKRTVLREETDFPAKCHRCRRGMKLDWKYCPWCFGAGYDPLSQRPLGDRRYMARCKNPGCTRKDLMRFMRYCPWCRSKVRQNWRIEGSADRCSHCGWGVVGSFWSHCPWCGKQPKG